MADYKFTTNIKYCSVYGQPLDIDDETARVDWSVDIDMRDWGIKGIPPMITICTVQFSWVDQYGETRYETIEIPGEKVKITTLQTYDTVLCPTLVEVTLNVVKTLRGYEFEVKDCEITF